MIYLLEDDDSIRELVCYSLEKTGNEARGFALPTAFYSAIEDALPSLIILDVMLPEEDGICVLKKIRSNPKTENIPVIMLTAKSSEFDKVTALDAGADDYIVKPFGVMELVARAKAVLRRSSKESDLDDKFYKHGSLEVCVARREVFSESGFINLTYKEFELLCLLFENKGRVLSRDRLLSEIWGYSFDGENRTVDVHIRTLRQKLGSHGAIIQTVRGVGYKIAD